ncbi:hypothetical protein pb186bvf_003960 [Paramecium bursaria]
MDRQQKLQILSVVSAGLFAGAALHVSVTEHPIRFNIPLDVAHEQWKQSYLMAAKFQSVFALVSSAAALYYYKQSKLLLYGGLLIFSVVPFTFLGIMPTNLKLLSKEQLLNDEQKVKLLRRWGNLHWVRTVASIVAFGILARSLVNK